MRFNISIAIVSMVNQTFIDEYKETHNNPEQNFSRNDSLTCSHLKSDEVYGENGKIVHEGTGEFNWDPYDQGIILSSFFWGMKHMPNYLRFIICKIYIFTLQDMS